MLELYHGASWIVDDTWKLEIGNHDFESKDSANKQYESGRKYHSTTKTGETPAGNKELKQEDEILDPPSTAATFVYDNNARVKFVVAACVIVCLLVLAAGLIFHRKKRTRQLNSREEFLILPKKRISNAIDPAFYNYVCPQQPIDFVIPVQPPPNLLNDLCNLAVQPPAAECHWIEESDPNPDHISSLLGGLNPELYAASPESHPEEFDFPEGHRGRLWFSLNYNVEMERLSVHLIKIKNLPSRVYGSPNCCDAFMRLSLLPDERRYLQSKVRKKNCNPFFDETFCFQLPSRSITERLVKVSVYDNDRGKRHNIIGHALLPLTDLNTSSTPIIQWKDLERGEEIQVPCDLGEIMVSLCYSHNLERLIVTVCEARKLQTPSGCSALDTFVKLIFRKDNKICKTKKTMVVRNSTDPKYNESFHFKMAQSAVNSCSVLLQVTQAGIKQKDKSLGRIVLGSYMFSRGKTLDQWNEAMSSDHKQIRYWQKLTA